MMKRHNWTGIRADVAEYCQAHKIQNDDFRFLNLYEWEGIYKKVLETFVDYDYARYNGLYWSNINNGFKKSIKDVFYFQEGAPGFPSYEWLEKFPQIVGSDKVYLLLEESYRYRYWIAECSPEVVPLIINDALEYFIDYYIVDKKFTWLVTENHHEIVQFIGDGLDGEKIKKILLEDH